MKSIWRFFASIELTIILAALIVMDAAWGSIIAVNNPRVFHELDQAILFPWLLSFGKSNLNLSLWIFILVGLSAIFAVNTAVCTIDRLYAIIKDKKPWQSFFPQIVHIGFLFAMLGHLLGSVYGFRSPGNVVFQGQEIPVPAGNGLMLRLDDMEIKASREKGLEDLKTKVTLLKDGKEVLKHDIQLNGPLIYKGIAFYHVDQGEAPSGFVLRTGSEYLRVKFGEGFKTGDGAYFRLGEIIPDFAQDQMGNVYSRSREFRNPYQEIVSSSGKSAWLALSAIGSRVNLDGREISLEDYINTQYAVLTINKDPGIGFIIYGSAILTIGMILLLFWRGERGELVRQRES